MFADAHTALVQIFTPPFRSVFIKCLALTLAILALAWIGLDHAILAYATPANPWAAWAVSWLAGAGLFVALAFLVAPVSLLVAGFFLDELAQVVEREMVGPARVGRALPVGAAVWLATKFAAIALLVNIGALMLLLVPGVNFIAFFAANAYLFSREYFELAALRYRPVAQVRELRSRNGVYLFLCGLFIAAWLAVPILNLLTPLFGVAFMTRIHYRLAPLPAPV